MENNRSILLLFISLVFLLSGFKKNKNDSITRNVIPAELSIADMRVVEGDAGQRPAEVMITVSQAMSAPVTVLYRTKDGSAQKGSDYIAGNSSVTFAAGEIMKKISIPVNGDRDLEASEKFEIILSSPSGATLLDSIGIVTIVNDDIRSGNLSIYEVRFTFTGYTTFTVGPPDCPIRPNGTVVLSGLLAGVENVSSGDNINYTGELQLDIDMDICSIKPGDPAKECGITVVGSGTVFTELDVEFDDRGAYIKIDNKSGAFTKSLFGSCDKAEIDEENTMIPNKSISTIFNGLDLPINGKLRVGQYTDQRDFGKLVIDVLRKLNP